MALVAYGSSGESDYSDDEVEEAKAPPIQTEVVVAAKQPQPKANPSFEAGGEISDEEDEEWIAQASTGIEDLDIPGLSTSKSLFASLPNASLNSKEAEPDTVDYIDENEDLSTIPAAKIYEPVANLTVKKDRKGPIKIMAPTLNQGDSDDDEPAKPRYIPRPGGGAKKSNLLSLLPPPKNSVSFVKNSTESSSDQSSSTAGSSSESLAKPNTLIPRSISRPPLPSTSTAQQRQMLVAKRQKAVDKKSTAENSDSDDDDEAGGACSFFTLEQEEIPASIIEEEAFKARLATVHATPQTSHHEFEENYQQPHQDNIYGPAIGVYPPPAPVASTSTANDNMVPDAEALQRLVGKTGLRKKRPGDEINFIEIKNDDIKPDPREWITNALTDDSEKGEPGPKCMIKGEKKRKHQITYLAALAKEREHVLKQQWSANAQSRRATQSKYGF